MKIQSKITLLFVLLSTGILLLLNAFILYFDYQFNYEDFFKRLETRVNITAQTRLFPGERSRAYAEVRKKYLEVLNDEKEYVISADDEGKFDTEGFPKEFIDEMKASGTARIKFRNNFLAGKAVSVNDRKYMIIVSARNPYGLRELEELQKILLIGFAGSLIVAFFVGKAFSYYTFDPIRKLTEQVKTISSDNLHLRLQEPAGKDEIAELTHTYNNMLTRLETAFDTQNNFVSNASHELRTPLTVITSELELALGRKDLNPEQREVFKTIDQQTDKLISILNSLLMLAQTGFDGKKQERELIRADELIWMCIAEVKKIRPAGNIELDLSAMPDDEALITLYGSSNLLMLAITNIINNACKYSNDLPVVIRLSNMNDQVNITVTDRGIGIPPAELPHIFQPFFRASNTSNFMGHGVGLPLTFNIVRMHKGTVNITSMIDRGTQVQVQLPVANQS